MTNAEKKIREFIGGKLGSDRVWVERGIVRIFEFQTFSEQTSEETNEKNDVGFSGADANLLSSFAKWLNGGSNRHLSERQLVYAFKKMPKYWKQIWSLIPQDKQKEILSKLV